MDPDLPSKSLVPRRTFLGMAAVAAAGPWPFADAASAEDADANQPLRLRPGAGLSDVVQVSAPKVLNGATIHRPLLREMFDLTLTSITGTRSPGDAWRSLLSQRDIIGLKFNQSGQYVIGTTPAVGGTMIESLIDAGFEAGRIVCFEAPEGLVEQYGCRAAVARFDKQPTDFGSGSDNLHASLDSVTALINVPFLKTHNIARMSGALKNLSHGLIKHPARYHANGCAPFVSDIVALPAIRGKLRLTLMDGLRVVFEGGPEATSHNVADVGALLASVDPVSVDAVGIQIINKVRVSTGLDSFVDGPEDVPFLVSAHRSGLGTAVAAGIRLRHLVL